MYTYLAYAGTVGDYRHYISIAISIAIITPLLLLLSWCSFNDVTFCDGQNFWISWPYADAQDRLLWRDKTCPART